MTEHVLQQQIEKNYIDSLLAATHKDVESVENTSLQGCNLLGQRRSGCRGATFPPDSQSSNEVAAAGVEVNLISNSISQQAADAKLTPAPGDSGITDDSLYQLLLVDGLKFAIPLSEITLAVDDSNAIIKDDMLCHDGEQLTIVNLAALIRPKDKSLNAGTNSKQYLLIQHRKLAIQCQQILEMETINEGLVCWQNENSQRKWLAGTVKQQGIAILDLANLQQMRV